MGLGSLADSIAIWEHFLRWPVGHTLESHWVTGLVFGLWWEFVSRSVHAALQVYVWQSQFVPPWLTHRQTDTHALRWADHRHSVWLYFQCSTERLIVSCSSVPGRCRSERNYCVNSDTQIQLVIGYTTISSDNFASSSDTSNVMSTWLII